MSDPAIVCIDTLYVNAAADLIECASRLGLKAAVICPPGAWSCEKPRPARVVETIDFSLPNLRRILSRLERKLEVRGFYSCFGPFRREGFVLENVAILAAERKLAYSPASALYKATNKYLAREALFEAGVTNVRYALATDESSLFNATRSVGYPLVLKPLTGVGSSLILKCHNDREALKNFRLALKELPRAHYAQLRMASHKFRTLNGRLTHFVPRRSMLVEQYIDGREVSVECLAVGNTVLPLVVHDKIGMQETRKIVFEHLLIAPPERFTSAELAEIRHYAVEVVRAIGLKNTFCHVELRYDKKLGPLLLEVNPRLGAGCIRDSVETFTGLDVILLQLSLVLGKTSVPRTLSRKRKRYALAALFSPRSGILREFSGLRRVYELPEVRVLRVGSNLGDRIGGDSEEIFLAMIFMEAADSTAAWKSYERIKKLVRIRVK